MPEWFDIVDEWDRPRYRATRTAAHTCGLRHRAVHILLQHPETQEWLLQRRSAGKDTHPLTWDSSASGHLDSGDTYHAAALRELREELAVTASGPLQPIGWLPPSDDTGQEFVWVYCYRHAGPFRYPPAEVIALKWMSAAAISEAILKYAQNFAPSFRLIWTTFVQQQA